MEECALRRLPKDILIKLISDIQNPDKMNEEYMDNYMKKMRKSARDKKVCKIGDLLKASFTEDIFDKLECIYIKSKKKIKRRLFPTYFLFKGGISVCVLIGSQATQEKGFSVRIGDTVYIRYITRIMLNENDELVDEVFSYTHEKYDEKILGKYQSFGFLALTPDKIALMSKIRYYLNPEVSIKKFDNLFKTSTTE